MNLNMYSHKVILRLRQCGHFLFFKMHGGASRQRIIAIVAHGGEVPQKTIQEMLGVRSGSISEILLKIENEGTIERFKSETDGRNIMVRLTEKGKETEEMMRQEYIEKVNQLLSCLTLDEQKNLAETLEKLLTHWKMLGFEEDYPFFTKHHPK